MLKVGSTYRRCWEPGDPSLIPPQFRDFSGTYTYLGESDGLHRFEGTHWHRGAGDKIALTDKEVERSMFELWSRIVVN